MGAFQVTGWPVGTLADKSRPRHIISTSMISFRLHSSESGPSTISGSSKFRWVSGCPKTSASSMLQALRLEVIIPPYNTNLMDRNFVVLGSAIRAGNERVHHFAADARTHAPSASAHPSVQQQLLGPQASKFRPISALLGHQGMPQDEG